MPVSAAAQRDFIAMLHVTRFAYNCLSSFSLNTVIPFCMNCTCCYIKTHRSKTQNC